MKVARADPTARASRYLVLILFSIAFGIEEAIIVLYLRLLLSQHGQVISAGILAPVMPPDFYHLESARELCTVVILAAVAGLASARLEQRLRYFLFAFGAWDIVYYIALWVLSGYPRITSEDVLFLIPVPWIAPVWAVIAFAAALMLLGLCGIARRRGPLLLAGLLLGWLSFVYEPFTALLVSHALDAQIALEPRQYPIWLFVPAFTLVALALPFTATKLTVR